jgi:hypothetical protein
VVITLTGLAVQTRGGVIGGVAFDPAFANVAIGGTTAADAAAAAVSAATAATAATGNASVASFDFGGADGYQIDFTIQRASTVLLWCAGVFFALTKPSSPAAQHLSFFVSARVFVLPGVIFLGFCAASNQGFLHCCFVSIQSCVAWFFVHTYRCSFS